MTTTETSAETTIPREKVKPRRGSASGLGGATATASVRRVMLVSSRHRSMISSGSSPRYDA
jgi:hypothetical protein